MNARIRAAGMVALVLLGVVAGPEAVARVAPKPPCRILVDEPDGSKAGASLELLSADLGTSATQITAVIRVAALSRSNSDAPTGQYWYAQWSVAGQPFPLFLGANVTPTGDRFEFGHRENAYRPEGTATGVIDEAHGEVRITAPLASWPAAKLRKGAKLTKIRADTYWFVGLQVGDVGGGSLQPGDSGTTTATHTVGTPTCVTVGK